MKRVMIKNTKGMSTVVSTVIMIALVIAAVAVVWGFVYPMIEENLESSGDCMDVMGKLEISNKYTCYDDEKGKFYFSIKTNKDISEVNKVMVLIDQGVQGASTVHIPGDSNVQMCSSEGNEAILPNGTTTRRIYYIDSSSNVDLIEIIPEVGGKECNTVDSIKDVRNCNTDMVRSSFEGLEKACGTDE